MNNTTKNKNNNHFDVIVVGARIAGSALAIELGKKGLRILLLDKTEFPADTLSTHFMNPRGMSYLKELGVLPEILAQTPAATRLDIRMDDFDLSGEVEAEALHARFARVHPQRRMEAHTQYASIRRTVLDPLLQKEAVRLGAEMISGFNVDHLIADESQVTGVRGRLRNGQELSFTAKLIVGADGRRSTVARLLNSEIYEERSACTFACYSYFEGLSLEAGMLHKRDRLAFAAVPTNHNAAMVLVYGPATHYESFRRNREVSFFKAIESINPGFAAQLRDQGKRVENFYSTNDQAAFMRKANRMSLPLLGDAAIFKDQCTASGMMHALRDAVLLSDHVLPYFEGTESLKTALNRFEESRYLDMHRFYDFTCTQAEMNPLREDERELFEAVAADPKERNHFVGLFCDTVEVRDFFAQKNIERLLGTVAGKLRSRPAKDMQRAFYNPFDPMSDVDLAYERSCVDFAQLHGKSFVERAEPYYDWYRARQARCAYPYSRTMHTAPGPESVLCDEESRFVSGINFASQDYLGLGQDPQITAAAQEAMRRFGPHSAGSPMVIGNTLLTRELEAEVSLLTGKKHVLLFPTGYAAGMGSILGLVRPHDHIVMDRLSHACLQQGANAATRKIHRFAHLDLAAARAVLGSIRARDARNAILLVTEGLFSMDADSPDLQKFQELAHEFEATLFVDVAHDLGASGPRGSGQIGKQKMLGKIDLVMGSFSKTFATNGGFLATDSPALIQYMKMYSSPHMFSNALSPVQTAIALEAARVVRSPKGEKLRQQLFEVVNLLRDTLAENGKTCLGEPSAIVPVLIGTEREARLCHRLMMERNIATMILEYPVVALGATRFRLQVMATHTRQQVTAVAKAIVEVTALARTAPLEAAVALSA